MKTTYSLDTDSRRWWWGPAMAGSFCAVAITAIVAVSTGSTALSSDPLSGSGTGSERPCFIVQPRWNSAISGPAPTCGLWDRAPDSPTPSGVLRPWLDIGG